MSAEQEDLKGYRQGDTIHLTVDNERSIMFGNSVILAPYERTNCTLRGAG